MQFGEENEKELEIILKDLAVNCIHADNEYKVEEFYKKRRKF